MPKIINLSGQKFGRLLVLGFIERRNSHSIFLCKCDCGKEVEASSNILRVGKKKSCGCYNLEMIKERTTTHGLSKHPIFKTWCDMKNRCYYKKHNRYVYYGGKGIKIYSEWLEKFINFYNWAIDSGWSKGLSIDRIDNSQDYMPTNCRWATVKEQNSNRTSCKYISFNGKTMMITQWAKELNLSYSAINRRIKKGLTLEKILIPKKF